MTTDSQLRFFNIAREISKMSDFNGIKKVKIGCVLIYKNRVISSGCNTQKTSPIQKRLNKYRDFSEEQGFPSLHAESNAIIHCRDDIKWDKVSVFIYREFADGTPACARFCKGCEAFMRSKGIKDVYYTGNYGYLHENLQSNEITVLKITERK